MEKHFLVSVTFFFFFFLDLDTVPLNPHQLYLPVTKILNSTFSVPKELAWLLVPKQAQDSLTYHRPGLHRHAIRVLHYMPHTYRIKPKHK